MPAREHATTTFISVPAQVDPNDETGKKGTGSKRYRSTVGLAPLTPLTRSVTIQDESSSTAAARRTRTTSHNSGSQSSSMVAPALNVITEFNRPPITDAKASAHDTGKGAGADAISSSAGSSPDGGDNDSNQNTVRSLPSEFDAPPDLVVLLPPSLTSSKRASGIRRLLRRTQSGKNAASIVDAIDAAVLEPCDIPRPILHAFEQRQGYCGQWKSPLHPQMEDNILVQSNLQPNNPMQADRTFNIFAVTDGHGGAHAAEFFIQRVAHGLRLLFQEKEWDWWCDEHRKELKHRTESLFLRLDREYGENVRKLWKELIDQKATGTVEGLRFEEQHKQLAKDAGCTIVVCVLFNTGELMTAHLGDARLCILTTSAVLPADYKPLPLQKHQTLPVMSASDFEAKQQKDNSKTSASTSAGVASEKTSLLTKLTRPISFLSGLNAGSSTSPGNDLYNRQWRLAFSTYDHHTLHPDKSFFAHHAGARFIDPTTGTAFERFPPTSYARVARPTNAARKDPLLSKLPAYVIGKPTANNTAAGSLSVGASLGDVLFKYPEVLLDASPDVSFLYLPKDQEFFMVLASDGLWDHFVSSDMPKFVDQISTNLEADPETMRELRPPQTPVTSSSPNRENLSSVIDERRKGHRQGSGASPPDNLPEMLENVQRLVNLIVYREESKWGIFRPGHGGKWDDVGVCGVFVGTPTSANAAAATRAAQAAAAAAAAASGVPTLFAAPSPTTSNTTPTATPSAQVAPTSNPI